MPRTRMDKWVIVGSIILAILFGLGIWSVLVSDDQAMSAAERIGNGIGYVLIAVIVTSPVWGFVLWRRRHKRS